jgi:hypothetical protein
MLNGANCGPYGGRALMTGNIDLIEQYKQLHAARVYGDTSVKNIRFLRPEIAILKPRSILDYGCGQSPLLERLELGYAVKCTLYDPAIPALSSKPEAPVDLLINIDVLEHIEERDLDAVIEEMRSLCRDAIIIVDTKPASTLLPDGRNAHVTIRSHVWWRRRLSRHFLDLFPIATARRSRAGFKTWSRPLAQSLRYYALRAVEDVSHYGNRVLRSRARTPTG